MRLLVLIDTQFRIHFRILFSHLVAEQLADSIVCLIQF